MLPFQENFSDPATLTEHWIVAPGMSVRNGALVFAPDQDKGFCAGVTRRNDFRDFSLTADVRIVRSAAALVLRARAPDEYYMVQFDLAFWEHGGEAGEYRRLRVEGLPNVAA